MRNYKKFILKVRTLSDTHDVNFISAYYLHKNEQWCKE